jgi:4-hydroxy-3-polyprenylbenzoate decarboxylase
VAWRTLSRWLADLERRGELLRINRPIKVELEAGLIADRLVKHGGPAVLFEKPELPDGSISEIPLAMNLFGTTERTIRALGVEEPDAIGKRMVALMKPDIGAIMKRPWKGLPLLKSALSMAPRRIRRAACQRIVHKDLDVTKLPIPKTWPQDGGRFITLPLVITKDSDSGEHNLGMYRGQIFGPTEIGLHWQIHKHGADHAAAQEGRMPVAICIGGPPELIFSAIAPLPDNLEEYMFAGLLANRRLRLVRAKTQDLLVPAEADIVIEGYAIPGETRTEGPFGDHFGYYSLEGEFPVMHVTAITTRKNAVLPATIVGLPPMEDGYLGEAVGDAFLPVLRFQHRDVINMFLPLETGFHNLLILASKQRYPRQARKTALGLLGAGQLMFLKVVVAVDPDHQVKDLEALLDALDSKADPQHDLITLPGMVADQLAQASPWENIHDKLLIDATIPVSKDPLHGSTLPTGPDEKIIPSVLQLPEIEQARMLRPAILLVTTKIEGGPPPDSNTENPNDEAARLQREQISKLINSIWQLENTEHLRWIFITDDEFDIHADGSRRRLLWQLFCRFEVSRDLHFDSKNKRVAWDATAPIPSETGPLPVRRWPAMTLHDSEAEERINNMAKEEGWPWV